MVSGIVLVPLYLKFIPLELYGAWLATGNILVWLTTLDPGLSTILQQQTGVAYGKQDVPAIRGIVTGGILMTTVIALLIVIGGFSVSRYMVTWLHLSAFSDRDVLLKAFTVAYIGSALMIFSYSITAINQGLQSSVGIGVIFVVVNVVAIVLTVFLLYNGFGLIGIAMMSLLRGLGLTLGNLGYLWWRLAHEQIGFTFSFRKVRTLSALMSYTFLGRAGGIVANNIDLFFTARFLGPETVAVLNLTRKAPETSRMFIERPAIAFMPAVSHLLGSGDVKKARAVLLRLVCFLSWPLGLLVGGFVVFNANFVTLWVGSHLFAGQAINAIVCGVFLLTVTSSSLANLCLALGNIKGNSIAGFIQALVQIPLVFVGAKYFGLYGVVLAPLISMLSVSAWYFPSSFARLVRLTPQDVKEFMSEILKVSLVSLAVTVGMLRLEAHSWVQFMMHVMMFCLLYGGFLAVASRRLRSELISVVQKFSETRKT